MAEDHQDQSRFALPDIASSIELVLWGAQAGEHLFTIELESTTSCGNKVRPAESENHDFYSDEFLDNILLLP